MVNPRFLLNHFFRGVDEILALKATTFSVVLVDLFAFQVALPALPELYIVQLAGKRLTHLLESCLRSYSHPTNT